MIRRQSPILGATGIDVGYRRAISFVLPRKKRAIEPIRGCTDPAALNYNPIATVDDGSCVICPEGTVCTVKIQAIISGHLLNGSECVPADTNYDVSATTAEAICNTTVTPLSCVGGCITASTLLSHTCPGPCIDGSEGAIVHFSAEVALFWSGTPGDHWFLNINLVFDEHVFCGADYTDLGGDSIYELDIGTDPSGVHNLSFDDPNFATVHYDITVTITPFAEAAPYCPDLGF